MKEINKLNNFFYKDLILPIYEVVFYIESIFIIKFDLTDIIFGGDLETFFIIEFLNEGDKD
jgi:hypothetical protein